MDRSGWWVAGILFLLLVFRDVVRKWITEAIEALRRVVFRWLAGSRLVRSRALSRYRAGVARRYESAHIPFLDTKMPMRDVYVPLAPPAPADALRLVVTGAPGSGKSWLLRHELLTSRERVAVLCELHRHNGSALTIEEQVAQQFELSGFPRAQRFIERALRGGQLAVLLDGFDEVSTSDRPRVAELIKDFGVRYPKARIVVTCRTAVYNHQLAPELTERYAIGEFDERMVRRFLRHWPGIEGRGSRVEQLMAALHDTPRVLQLARNPLLLTMISYLYAHGDERRQLPHSRAEFYQEATDYLLRRLKDATNRFDGQTKKAVLQRLALACMEAPPGTADRLTVPHRSVIDIMSRTLPELNEAASEARPMLAEIVERSGLLLAVDGGDRYQFAHLTLQEFLAACELHDSPEALLERYSADPTRWRECVKLWCGVTEQDCTEVVRAVFELDPVLGLESLADTRKLDGVIADRIIEEMLGRLDDPAVVDAFGVVASDPRPRGTAVYERLVDRAIAGQPGALHALAATNTAKAVPVLTDLAMDNLAARDALVSMGDLAVPVLADIAADWATDGLAKMATPAAIKALIRDLWHGYRRAAWHLASLMRDPEVQAAIAVAPQHWETRRNWYWEPFQPSNERLAYAAGRIGDLLNTPGADKALPSDLGMLDPRVGVPLWIEAEKSLPKGYSAEQTEAMKAIVEKDPAAYEKGRRLLPEGRALWLLDHLDRQVAIELMYDWIARHPASKQDWLQVRRIGTGRFDFDGSVHHRLVYFALLALLTTATIFSVTSGWLGAVTIGLNLLSLYPLILDKAHDNFNVLGRYSLGWIRVWFAVVDREFGLELGKAAVTGTATALSFFVALMNVQQRLGWWAAIGILASACAGVAAVIRLGMRKRDRWGNPLRHVIHRIDEMTEPTSIIH